ncbi:M20 metallopeptidase family protein [Rhodohalobacter mucosus]|uniref:Amidohydrolase n=1 Tax=Rhodohalobacter mucosus TaxID=2079485 RepID=A0A316TT01_9BACT|nr:M20 family metallopeptidase [Rhodohalobacter mucosus]PWN05372.1 amidohydrolase [Rhodohalobacter mucosus]
MADLRNIIAKKAEDHFDYMVQTRRYLHKNPEVSFREYDTTDYIIHELKKIGLEAERPLETGCVAVIEGKPSDRVIALRADIDALAMDEEGEAKKEFFSERPGAAHCCGHDAHTANLLGAANIINDLSDELEGTVVLVFQPGEESLPGGGKLLTETGYLQKLGVKEIYGLHMNPDYSPGKVALKEGPIMARPDEFEIEITGRGGHAASPHLTVDPVVIMAQIITQFQTIVSRTLDPAEPAVVTVGRVRAGSTYNVIPGKAEMIGTVRTFSRETAMRISDQMERILKGAAESSGITFTFNFNEGYPAVVNDPACTRKLVQTAQKIAGTESVIEMEKPLMAGEDFSFYQQQFPGAFFMLGSGSKKADSKWSWHHPRYNIDEDAFLTGSSLMAGIALGV